jgi:hypothetical protein
MNTNMHAGIDTVYFIRADRFLFTDLFHTRPYKDEFGAPSTSRDWVPEPLIKQYVFESTRNRTASEKLIVKQFEDITEFNNANIHLSKNNLLIDMNKVLAEYVHQSR